MSVQIQVRVHSEVYSKFNLNWLQPYSLKARKEKIGVWLRTSAGDAFPTTGFHLISFQFFKKKGQNEEAIEERNIKPAVGQGPWIRAIQVLEVFMSYNYS